MRLGRRVLIPAAGALLAALAATPALAIAPEAASAATLPAFTSLDPGATQTLSLKVPVNVVLVGYDAKAVGSKLRAQLAAKGDPIVRYPVFYGVDGRDLGLHFSYDYRIIDTPKSFEDAFFGHLAKVGKVTNRTTLQTQYNQQKHNNTVVPKKILTIDAPSTESYLEKAAANKLGIDVEKSYTVFLVNWWDRDDFRFHVYRKTNEPDPDTGVNFGADYNGTAMIAWGGSSGRSWFYDLSAGPESWTSNWDVDDADVDGDGEADYRMPPVWEYAKNGYRAKAKLGKDLGLVVRYVAVNLLFTTSPLYDPLATAPDLGGAKHVHLTMFEDDPASQGTDWLHLTSSKGEWEDLQPQYPWKTSIRDVDPITKGPDKALAIFSGNSDKPGCWHPYGDYYAQFFCYFSPRADKYLPAAGNDYVEGVFAYNTTDEAMGTEAGLLGFADDNWVDGTPTYVYEFDTPGDRDAGYGFTTTTTHEVGHHLGMSHPHDGYDPTTGLDYDAVGDFYFAWSGDESNTIMQYIAVSNTFGVFDEDNMGRYLAAGYLNWANALLGELDGTTLTSAQKADLVAADALAGKARSAFKAWDFQAAATYAFQAWNKVGGVAVDHGLDARPGAFSALRLALPNGDAPRIDGEPRHPEK
jgi:hypothetical protein